MRIEIGGSTGTTGGPQVEGEPDACESVYVQEAEKKPPTGGKKKKKKKHGGAVKWVTSHPIATAGVAAAIGYIAKE